jgi:hypothetical protein
VKVSNAVCNDANGHLAAISFRLGMPFSSMSTPFPRKSIGAQISRVIESLKMKGDFKHFLRYFRKDG